MIKLNNTTITQVVIDGTSVNFVKFNGNFVLFPNTPYDNDKESNKETLSTLAIGNTGVNPYTLLGVSNIINNTGKIILGIGLNASVNSNVVGFSEAVILFGTEGFMMKYTWRQETSSTYPYRVSLYYVRTNGVDTTVTEYHLLRTYNWTSSSFEFLKYMYLKNDGYLWYNFNGWQGDWRGIDLSQPLTAYSEQADGSTGSSYTVTPNLNNIYNSIGANGYPKIIHKHEKWNSQSGAVNSTVRRIFLNI